MPSVGSFEAKIHLSALLERVQSGEHITITERGVPIARLIPAQTQPENERRLVISGIKEFGRGRTLPQGITVRDLIAAGRRF